MRNIQIGVAFIDWVIYIYWFYFKKFYSKCSPTHI